MANLDAPIGAKPVRNGLTNAPYSGSFNVYLVPATDGTAMFIGDFVKLAGSAGSAGTVVYGRDVDGVPTVAQAAAGDTLVLGVVVGFSPNQNDLTQKHRASSQARLVYVVDDPDMVFEIQEDSVGSSLKAADVGENADLIVAAGSTTTGLSGMEIDSSTHATTTAQLRILRLVPRPDNVMGDGGTTGNVNAKWEVVINEHAFKTTTAV